MIRLPHFVSNTIGPYFANPIWWRIRSRGRINVAGDTILVDHLYKFKFNNRTEYISTLRNLNEVFIDGIYKINVSGKVVLDVGSNIADSPIYFISRGAYKVIGVEPFPATFKLAEFNLRQNNLDKQIEMVNAAIGVKPGIIRLGENNLDSSNLNAFACKTKGGQKIPVVTLKQLIHKYLIEDAIAKFDCEGAEYDVIMKAEKSTLQAFTDIIVEYDSDHVFYENESKQLEQKFDSVGFTLFSINENTSIMHFRRDD
jgi:FkbM family methyltransferase